MTSAQPLSDAATALRELILAGEHYRHATSVSLGVDVSQTQALSYLYSRGDLGQSELGALLGYNTSSMTALVDRLERRRWAERLPHPTDRRRSTVHLTAEGRTAVELTGTWLVHAFDSVHPKDLPGLTADLLAIAGDLRAHTPDITPHPS